MAVVQGTARHRSALRFPHRVPKKEVTMSKQSITVILALAGSVATAPAFASNGFTPRNNEAGGTTHPMPSTQTREQVRQEARNGTFRSGEATYAPELEQATGTRSRAEVVNEAEHARDDKTLRELYRN
jgi:hypothetical protein